MFGFDIDRHDYGTGGYPGDLVLQDVLTLHGSQFRDAAVIVASPPCQKYSYMAMPWKRAKQMAAEYRSGVRSIDELNALFNACFRIQREASEAAGRYIPLIVENVRGAQPWVGRSRGHYGSFHLWGDAPALMPSARMQKVPGMNFHDHEKTGEPGRSFQSAAVKVSGLNWSGSDKPGCIARGFNTTADPRQRAIKGTGGSWFTPTEDGRTVQGHWRDGACITRNFNSKSNARKAASAQIAKIPFPLARHIARCFKPQAVLA